MHHSADISHFSLFLDFVFKESDVKQVWTSATSYKWPCAKRIVCWELKLGANRLLLTSSLPLKGWLYHCQNRNSPCPDRFHVIDIGWLFTEVPFPVHIHHGSTRCFILLYPLCHFTAGLSFIIYLACLQLGSSAPQREPFFLGNGYQKYISISEQQIVPIADCRDRMSPCLYLFWLHMCCSPGFLMDVPTPSAVALMWIITEPHHCPQLPCQHLLMFPVCTSR